MRRLIFTLLCIQQLVILSGQTPHVSAGTVEHLKNFPSIYVQTRDVDVWLPPGYNKNTKYAVLYMHDGQMLFDGATTWNKQEWKVDETMDLLLKNNQVRPTIVVGIGNTDDRWLEFFPLKPFNSLSPAWQDSVLKGMKMSNVKPLSDLYLKFIVKELKPFIDSAYSTLRDPSNTYTAGSSLGGLISMYAVCEYPNVFGGAACLSTHWPGGQLTDKKDNKLAGQAFARYMKARLPSPLNHKFYFDYGSIGVDKFYEPYQKEIDKVMKAKGYGKGNWLTLRFEGADHNEDSWSKRLAGPLFFLVGNPIGPK